MAKLPIELAGVAETLAEGDGAWRTCSGCHETEDGYPVGVYVFSKILNCTLGDGCLDCGGIGAVWDNTDYDDMAAFMLEQERAERDGKAEYASWFQAPVAGVETGDGRQG